MFDPGTFGVQTQPWHSLTSPAEAFESNPFRQTGWKNDQFVKVVESLMQRDMSLKKKQDDR